MSPILESIGSVKGFGWGALVADDGSYESIATVTVGSGGQSTITFSSIPSTYKNLQIRGIVRNTGGAGGDNLYMRYNGDTATNYTAHFMHTSGANAAVDSIYPWEIMLPAFIPTNDQTANIYCSFIIDILDYADTNKFKTFKSLSGFDLNTSGKVGLFSGLWRNTNAISSITFVCSNNFIQYSEFALYGTKES